MTSDNPNITVFLIDDDDSVRDALSLLIESEGMQVQSFASAQAFLDSYQTTPKSCLVLDFRMPNMSGLELQNELKNRHIDIPIIFISAHADVPASSKAFRAGAVDFLQKPFDNTILLARIQEAVEKHEITREKNSHKHETINRYQQLTKREKQVLDLIAKGHSNKESAQILGVSNRTIDVHRAHIMEKMQAGNLADLMVMAMHCDIL